VNKKEINVKIVMMITATYAADISCCGVAAVPSNEAAVRVVSVARGCTLP